MSRFLSVLTSVALVTVLAASHPGATGSSRAAAWGFIRLENVLEAPDLGIAKPGALAWDAAAHALKVSDRLTGRAELVGTKGGLRGALSPAQAPHGGSLSTIDRATGHTFTLDLADGLLKEANQAGDIVTLRNVAAFHLQGVEGIAVAPSADSTDPADASSLYVSLANASDDASSTGPGIVEFALTATPLAAALASVPDNVGHRIKTIDTVASNWNPFSPDPSGIAYVDSLGKFAVGDGEIEEENVNNYPYPGSNVWHMDPVTGAANGVIDTTSASPVNNEPVGVGYDKVANELYISKDGSTSRVWAYTRTNNLWVLRNSISLTSFGIGDAEGLAFANNQLYVADGSNKDVYVIGAGPDNKVATGDDVEVRHFDTAALGISDPEGIGVDFNTGNLWILSHRDGEGMIETTPTGTLLSTTHFDFATDNPGGLDIAPSSSTSDAPTVMSAWVAQRGVDNNNDPNEKDGKIFEVAIQGGSPPPPPGELVQNGDFESGPVGGAPPSWTTNANFTTSSTVVHGGAQSGRHFSNADAGYKIEQTVLAAPGAYNFSAWANPVVTSDAFSVVFKVQWRTDKTALATVTIGKVTKTTTAGWHQYASTLTAPAGTTHARVSMVVSSLKTTVYVDDISLSAP